MIKKLLVILALSTSALFAGLTDAERTALEWYNGLFSVESQANDEIKNYFDICVQGDKSIGIQKSQAKKNSENFHLTAKDRQEYQAKLAFLEQFLNLPETYKQIIRNAKKYSDFLKKEKAVDIDSLASGSAAPSLPPRSLTPARTDTSTLDPKDEKKDGPKVDVSGIPPAPENRSRVQNTRTIKLKTNGKSLQDVFAKNKDKSEVEVNNDAPDTPQDTSKKDDAPKADTIVTNFSWTAPQIAGAAVVTSVVAVSGWYGFKKARALWRKREQEQKEKEKHAGLVHKEEIKA